jgi:amidase
VVCPSAVSGIVGIKPTIGLVSRSELFPYRIPKIRLDQWQGTVKDAAILLGILAGIDSKDPVTNESKGKAQTDYTKF